jgi:hypothetical protein
MEATYGARVVGVVTVVVVMIIVGGRACGASYEGAKKSAEFNRREENECRKEIEM